MDKNAEPNKLKMYYSDKVLIITAGVNVFRLRIKQAKPGIDD